MKIRKKIVVFTMSVLMVLSLCACKKGTNPGKRTGSGTGVQDVLDEGVASETATEEQTTTEEKTTEKTTEETTEATTDTENEETTAEGPREATVVPPEIDVDLTKLSSTMVYSEVYNMMVDPESYEGKTIKAYGPFSVYTDETTGKVYFACIIQDATACCSQGLEFQLAGDYTYPEDYPNVGDMITVTGEFSTYTEDGYLYVSLLDAKLE
ncbi:MAG: hypothetical protein IJT72_02090 [Lachnospiraceae bacterium]|nr:hypothetical protein [Lachnospiraceae bacterium]